MNGIDLFKWAPLPSIAKVEINQGRGYGGCGIHCGEAVGSCKKSKNVCKEAEDEAF